MASALYSQDLTCSVCWTIFTDPVTLLCGHSFCRDCVTGGLSSEQPRCPQCGTAGCLPTSHILKSLAEKAREAERTKKEEAEVAELCPEHGEKLKLFCVTDQQLVCIICRDGERHGGHKFKPIREAAASLRQELEKSLEKLCGDNLATERLANTQREERAKTKEKSQQLTTQIRRQFEEMHQFLRKREDEIQNELKHKEEDAVEKMSKSLNAIERALSESRELEGKLTSMLKTEDSERLIKSWTEVSGRRSPEQLLKSRADDLRVVTTSLSLGPHESHLQFFMWKEMLQVIQPRAELLSLKRNNADITVSDDGRSLFYAPRSNQAPSGYSSGFRLGSSFGSPSASASKSGLFGSSTAPGSTFGSPSASASKSGLFGSSAAPGSTFGSPSASASKSGLFGSSAAPGSTFGSPSASASKYGLFGSSTAPGSTFGSPSASASKYGLFGSSTAPGSTFGSTTESKQGLFVNPAMGSGQTPPPPSKKHVFSVNEFTSGQHYWEIEVGHRDYWELGINDHFLKYDDDKYATCSPDITTELTFGDSPRKIGIYLNCASKKLSFYDADNMTHIHTLSSGVMATPLSAYFNIRAGVPDHNPLTVCWY